MSGTSGVKGKPPEQMTAKEVMADMAKVQAGNWANKNVAKALQEATKPSDNADKA